MLRRVGPPEPSYAREVVGGKLGIGDGATAGSPHTVRFNRSTGHRAEISTCPGGRIIPPLCAACSSVISPWAYSGTRQREVCCGRYQRLSPGRMWERPRFAVEALKLLNAVQRLASFESGTASKNLTRRKVHIRQCTRKSCNRENTFESELAVELAGLAVVRLGFPGSWFPGNLMFQKKSA